VVFLQEDVRVQHLEWATTDSFQMFSNSLFMDYSNIRCSVMWDMDTVFNLIADHKYETVNKPECVVSPP
jgi:hypothetical protein